MKIYVVLSLCLFSWGLLCQDPSESKVVTYLEEINTLLMTVAHSPLDCKQQSEALRDVRVKLTEAIQVDNIQNAALYAIAGIVFDDPVYAARAVRLDKDMHHGRANTVFLERKYQKVRNQGEREIDILRGRLEMHEQLSISPECSEEDQHGHKMIAESIGKSIAYIEAQMICSGALREAVAMYKKTKEQGEK